MAVTEQELSNWRIIVDILTIVVAAAAALGAGAAVYHARRTLQFQVLYDLQREYRTPEMFAAVTALWKFHDENPETMKERFRRILREQPIERMSPQERGESLDNSRRIVSHFFSQLAVMYLANTVPRPEVLGIWSLSNLRIIPDVMVQLENVKMEENPRLPRGSEIGKEHHLLRFYEEAKAGRRTFGRMISDAIRGLGCPFRWTWQFGAGRVRRRPPD